MSSVAGRLALARRGRQSYSAAALAAAAVVAVLLVALLSGGSGSPGGGTAASDARAAAATVDAFDRAVARRDFATVCNRLFTASARAAAGGDGCPAQLAQGSASLADTTLKAGPVVLSGDRGTATIVATRAGRPPRSEALLLQRAGPGFRISAATAPPEE